MKIRLAERWIEYSPGLKPHAYTVDTKGSIYDRKLDYKFDGVGEILAYLAKLMKESEELQDEWEWEHH